MIFWFAELCCRVFAIPRSLARCLGIPAPPVSHRFYRPWRCLVGVFGLVPFPFWQWMAERKPPILVHGKAHTVVVLFYIFWMSAPCKRWKNWILQPAAVDTKGNRVWSREIEVRIPTKKHDPNTAASVVSFRPIERSIIIFTTHLCQRFIVICRGTHCYYSLLLEPFMSG